MHHVHGLRRDGRLRLSVTDLILKLEDEGHMIWESPELPDGAFDAGEVCLVMSTGRLWVSTGLRWLLVEDRAWGSGSGS